MKSIISKVYKKIKTIYGGLPERLYNWIDFRLYAGSLTSYKKIAKHLPPDNKGSLLIVSGRGMNVIWAQMWTVLSLAVRIHGYRGFVLTTHAQEHLNRYFKLLNLELIFFDDFVNDASTVMTKELSNKLANSSTFEDYRSLYYKDAPIGQIALSTYSRYQGTGVINLSNPKVRKVVDEWIALIYRAMHIAETIYEKYNVQYLYFTEVFMEEYGAFYYAALSKNLNITRFAGTVRDNAIIVQHLSKDNDRVHHASLSQTSWEKIKKRPYTSDTEAALTQNFLARYGNKWHRSKRNHPNTQIMPIEEARKILGIVPERKVAVIYSHILYDTLFFFGTDLFNDYAEWLIETVRVACQNTKIDWFIKVHPSNLWRGELKDLLHGKYEEERILESAFGQLPTHVRIISADTRINPYTWFQLADYGITVRGTSGLEMAALGKTVITAGTGRYEGNGFTIDPPDKKSYLDLLKKLPYIASPTQKQIELAKRYAYAIFILKPFTLSCLKPRLKTGRKEMSDSDDMIYRAIPLNKKGLPQDLKHLAEWIVRQEDQDLLSE